MQINFFLFISFLLLSFGCSGLFSSQNTTSRDHEQRLKPEKKNYLFIDQAGEFLYEREVGFIAQGNQLIVKRQVLPSSGDTSQAFERSIAISNPGRLNQNRILRPQVSQYTVWFDGERYFTEIRLNEEKEALDISFNSPEKDWQGKKTVSFPRGSGLYCFFTQVIECALVSDFLEKSMELEDGVMTFHIIWEGYPYVQEQYPGIPNQVFSSATFSYDGRTSDGYLRYALSFAGQTIFYHIDENFKLAKKFWVAQGLTITVK